MPTGWRPEDVRIKYPKQIVTDPYTLMKYDSNASRSLAYWSVFQFSVALILLLFMFYNYSEIGLGNLLLFGLYVFISIYAFTSLMDRNRFTLIAESIRFIYGMAIVLFTGGWFGLEAYWTSATQWMVAFMIFSLAGSIYFMHFEKGGNSILQTN